MPFYTFCCILFYIIINIDIVHTVCRIHSEMKKCVLFFTRGSFSFLFCFYFSFGEVTKNKSTFYLIAFVFYSVSIHTGHGVYISRIEEGSVAERAGLRPGDTILEVNGTPFTKLTHEEALKVIFHKKIIKIYKKK